MSNIKHFASFSKTKQNKTKKQNKKKQNKTKQKQKQTNKKNPLNCPLEYFRVYFL